ncbi:MAG TPA: XdhC family protein, partial [bacterium]|nr:XdhC family protein [bacterium]
PAAAEADFPQQTCLIQNDLDYSQLNITPRTYVVIATLHKGDHLSMQRALEGQARYIGLVASQRRSGLVVDFLRERGIAPERMANVHAPAGLDLGAANPREIALSIMSEIVAVRHGGSCRPLREVESNAGTAPQDCLHQSP